MYGMFFKAVAQEIGMKRALALQAKLGEPFGAQIGETLKQKFGNKNPDTESLKNILQPMYKRFGFTNEEYKVTPKTLSITFPSCPFYEGFKAAGLDHETIMNMCKAMGDVEYNLVKNLYPKVEPNAQFRESPKGSCLEKWTIKQ
jgi:hypothetical protein